MCEPHGMKFLTLRFSAVAVAVVTSLYWIATLPQYPSAAFRMSEAANFVAEGQYSHWEELWSLKPMNPSDNRRRKHRDVQNVSKHQNKIAQKIAPAPS